MFQTFLKKKNFESILPGNICNKILIVVSKKNLINWLIKLNSLTVG